MADRLSALDASFLYVEEPTTPMHVGAVSLFRRPRSGFDYERMVALIEQRIALVSRYRQEVREVPGCRSRPVFSAGRIAVITKTDAMSDVDTLAALIEESLEELVSTVPAQ